MPTLLLMIALTTPAIDQNTWRRRWEGTMIGMTRSKSLRATLLAAVSLSGLALAAPATAQNAPAPATVADEQNQEIVIVGYRASLQSSTNAKKESTTFTD